MADDANRIVELSRRLGVKVPPSEEPVIARHPMQWRELEMREPPVRTWRISYWLTAGPTLFAGPGGIGKTLVAQTVATALVLGRRYVDEVHGESRVLFWACEDDHDELWRRQVAICKYFGVRLSDLEGRLIIEPRLGMDNGLFTTTFGAPGWTPLRQELIAQVNDYRADTLFLDNIGQTFGGSENDRHHVTAFVNGLAGLAPGRDFTPVLMGHPAKQAGSEFSGSTAWENAVRMRWYLGATLPDQKAGAEEEVEDPNVRYLAKRKSNYTAKDFRKLVYRDGVFVPESGPGEFTQRYTFAQRQEGAEDAILDGIRKLAQIGQHGRISPTSPDYLPKKLHAFKISLAYTGRDLREAMNRLLLSGRIQESEVGKKVNRTPRLGLVIAP